MAFKFTDEKQLEDLVFNTWFALKDQARASLSKCPDGCEHVLSRQVQLDAGIADLVDFCIVDGSVAGVTVIELKLLATAIAQAQVECYAENFDDLFAGSETDVNRIVISCGPVDGTRLCNSISHVYELTLNGAAWSLEFVPPGLETAGIDKAERSVASTIAWHSGQKKARAQDAQLQPVTETAQ